MNKEPEILYHYTDFNAMRGIISKGEIWLWNLRRMNDRREMDYFIESLKSALKKQVLPEYLPVMEKIFSQKLKDFHTLSSFASCFSEYSDDAAQWARYAKNGMGVCIAFDKEMLSKIGEAGHVPLCRVSYSKNIDDLEIVKKIARLINKNEASSSDSAVDQIFYSLVSSSPLFKHPSFISEKEYRLVSHPLDVEKHLGKPDFFVEETNIKKYYVLNLKEICQNLNMRYTDLFREVCIGPQALVTQSVLSDYFEFAGVPELAEKIKLSECPLRRF